MCCVILGRKDEWQRIWLRLWTLAFWVTKIAQHTSCSLMEKLSHGNTPSNGTTQRGFVDICEGGREAREGGKGAEMLEVWSGAA